MDDAREDKLELVEFERLSLRDWRDLTGRDPAPFGAEQARLEWRAKDHHIGLRDGDGRLVAAGGYSRVEIEVAGVAFEVAGMGSMIVRSEYRGQGRMREVADAIARRAEALGPALGMIFCRPELLGLYRGRRYTEITDPVWVDQPEGRVEMPPAAMWRPLHAGATWPAGRVDVRGLPF